jgi:hypothetical protein
LRREGFDGARIFAIVHAEDQLPRGDRVAFADENLDDLARSGGGELHRVHRRSQHAAAGHHAIELEEHQREDRDEHDRGADVERDQRDAVGVAVIESVERLHFIIPLPLGGEVR